MVKDKIFKRQLRHNKDHKEVQAEHKRTKRKSKETQTRQCGSRKPNHSQHK